MSRYSCTSATSRTMPDIPVCSPATAWTKNDDVAHVEPPRSGRVHAPEQPGSRDERGEQVQPADDPHLSPVHPIRAVVRRDPLGPHPAPQERADAEKPDFLCRRVTDQHGAEEDLPPLATADLREHSHPAPGERDLSEQHVLEPGQPAKSVDGLVDPVVRDEPGTALQFVLEVVADPEHASGQRGAHRDPARDQGQRHRRGVRHQVVQQQQPDKQCARHRREVADPRGHHVPGGDARRGPAGEREGRGKPAALRSGSRGDDPPHLRQLQCQPAGGRPPAPPRLRPFIADPHCGSGSRVGGAGADDRARSQGSRAARSARTGTTPALRPRHRPGIARSSAAPIRVPGTDGR